MPVAFGGGGPKAWHTFDIAGPRLQCDLRLRHNYHTFVKVLTLILLIILLNKLS